MPVHSADILYLGEITGGRKAARNTRRRIIPARPGQVHRKESNKSLPVLLMSRGPALCFSLLLSPFPVPSHPSPGDEARRAAGDRVNPKQAMMIDN